MLPCPPPPSITREKDEYTQSIIADMQRLGLRYAGITYTSGAALMHWVAESQGLRCGSWSMASTNPALSTLSFPISHPSQSQNADPDYFEQLAECARRMIAKGYLC